MFRKIVVGTDGMGPASKAVRRAVQLAASTGAELIAVNIRPPSPASSAGADLRGAATVPGIDAARGLLQDVAKRYGDVARISTRVAEGDPADALLDLAREEEADLLVVGSKGMTESRRFFVSSVPNTISHRARCHVLIARTDEEGAHSTHDRYSKIVVGIDGSETAARALKHALLLAKHQDAQVAIVSVVESSDVDPAVKEVLKRAALSASEEGVEAQTLLEKGEPAETILSVAKQQDADLIVLGNKGMTGVGRFIGGGVPNHVSHHVECDLLIAQTTLVRL